MYPTQFDFLVRQEQIKDLSKTMERERLIRMMARQSTDPGERFRKVIKQLVTQMKLWSPKSRPDAPVTTVCGCDCC